MANATYAFGFLPITPNAREQSYTIASGYSTAINKGDPVAGSGTGNGALPGIVIGVAGSAITGIFLGCYYTDSNGQPQFSLSWPASTTATNIKALVIDDPFCQFAVECDGALAITDYWNKAGFVSGAGVLGVSGYQLQSSSIGTGTDLQIRRLYDTPNNAVGTNAVVVVGLMNHTMNYPYTAI